MGFHEKSALACLISICFVYVPYFIFVFRFPMAAVGLFWISAIGLVALLAAFHCVNAIATRSIRTTGDLPPVDELDHKIELQAAKWSGFILAFAVVTWVLVAMYSIPVMDGGDFTIPVVTAMTAVHWLFAGFVLANIAYYGGIVLGYRKIASE